MITIIAKKSEVSIKEQMVILKKIREALLKDSIAKQICQEHGFKTDIILGIPIDFESDLEASAKTVNSRIILNSNLLDEDFKVIMRYAIHELVHALQHMISKKDDQENYKTEKRKVHYLDIEQEEAAFQKQLLFQNETKGPKDVKKYLKELLDYHKVPMKERSGKAEELLEEVSEEDPEILESIRNDYRKNKK